MPSRLKIAIGSFVGLAAVGAALVPFSGAGAASSHNPVGRVDSATLRADHRISVSGWAFDADAPNRIEAVDIYVNGRFLGRVGTTGARADVKRVYPTAGTRSGFSWVSPNSIGYGSHNTCVFALNIGAGSTTSLGCTDVGLWDAKHPKPKPPAVSKGAQIAALARAQVGRPYVFGGTSPAGFDCSGLAYYTYRQNGIALNRDAQAQYHQARALSQAAARPGDLIFFHDGSGYVYHVAVFEGGNMMVAAADYGEGVKYQSIWSSAVTFGTLTH